MGEKIKLKDLIYEKQLYIYGFHQLETIRFFGDNISTGKISIDRAEMDQNNLLENMIEFNDKTRPKKKKKKKNEDQKKRHTFDNLSELYEGQELTLNAFKSRIFPIKAKKCKRRPPNLAMQLKMLAPKQKFQRLPIAFAQVKASNTSQKLLNEIRQIIYSLH